MSNIVAILKKQIRDTLKNKTVLIQFIMFPALTWIMSNTVRIDGMPENFFVILFAAMYAGMAPLTSIAAIIAEEKEKNTLRILLMSNVKPCEYLTGVGSYIWAACMLGAFVICAAGGYTLRAGAAFMAVMAAGILASLLIGAAIGVRSKTQMAAASVSVPVMMIFSFLPMLSMFNAGIAKIAKYTWSGQISILLNRISSAPGMENIGIIAINMLLFAALFAAAYRRCGLE
ncbi:MAG: ABC transporter permease [Lachnospiraceae bacterium]|nr:ABC transporter permease [Lachnospiraceae bacterium]